MINRWYRNTENFVLIPVALLGAWLAAPSRLWAALAVGAGVFTILVGMRRGGLRALIGTAGLIAAGGAALATSWRVSAVERRWPAVREQLIRQASRRLNASLEDAVRTARALADRGAAMPPGEPLDPVTGSPEAGLTLLDPQGRPVMWTGRHRYVPDAAAPAELSVRFLPAYVILEARRAGPNRIAVGQVLLAADSAVPDGSQSVSTVYSRETGSVLEFFPRGSAPEHPDVFDYCLPSCVPSPDNLDPDTLFSIRTTPPSQGVYKLDLIATGGRAVVWLLGIGLAAVIALAAPPTRRLALLAGAALLILTPAGAASGLDRWFSPATYYLGWLDPVTASAGSLLAAGGAAFMIVAAAAGLSWHSRAAAGLSVLIMAVVPFAARFLAGGVSRPPGGAGVDLWIAWSIALTLALTAILLVAFWLRGPLERERKWVVTAALLLAALAAIAGVAFWRPGAGWAWWYPALWIPAVWLVAAAHRPVARLFGAAVVSALAAAVFIWGAAIQGRVALAQDDASRLGRERDPVVVAMLEQLRDALRAGDPPRTPVELYRRWQLSQLSADGYPATLGRWSPAGDLLAELQLAELDLPPRLLQALAMGAAERGSAGVVELTRVPGIHAVLSVPLADGSVVTVGVGPRSRLIRRVGVARFLAPNRRVPYEMSLSDPGALAADAGPAWQREGRLLRGQHLLDLPGGRRQLLSTIDLRSLPAILIRGTLLVALDVAVVLLLWGVSETIVGRLALKRWTRDLVRPLSYQVRLALALAVFFVVPTVGFAAWIAGRLGADMMRARDEVLRQSLRDAAAAFPTGAPADARVRELSSRVGGDLLWYEEGVLAAASSPLLLELGLVDALLPAPVFQVLKSQDALETTADVTIAGRPTRVGFRAVGAPGDAGILAAPRLGEEAGPVGEADGDLAFGLLFATLAGAIAAAGLARVAARTLARPVQALSQAAVAVGRGDPVPALGEMPDELVSVAESFTRMARDVRASQAALEDARRRTAAVLRNVATGVIALSRDLSVSLANPRAEQLVGAALPAEEAVRARTSGEWEPVWSWVARFLAGSTDLEAQEFTVGGRRIRVQVSRLGAEAGGCVVALDDVTELAHAVRVIAWGELARQVAHEIKNPLTPLRLGIQHLQRAYAGPRGDFQSVLDRTGAQILAEIDRLDSVARAFSRFGTPHSEPEAGPLEVVDLVSVARETAALYALGKNPVISLAGDGPVRGLTRRDELKEVLVNLVENARNAQAGTVELRVAPRPAGRVALLVRDDGRGIDPSNLPRIFEPHFSTTTSGTGLGLAICRRLVESWGGAIAVESEAGRGTTVRVEMVEASH